MERIIIDTDIGTDVDDAYALLFALKSPDLSLEGVTTVYGKTDIRAKVARKLLDYTGRDDIPVHAGIATPMTLGSHGIVHTGREGEGILTSIDYKKSLQDMNIGENAVDFLIERIQSNPGEYTLVAIGALTNIATAFEREPGIMGKIKRMYIMGGNISHEGLDLDNLVQNGHPEYNVACDARAAQIVFSSPVQKIVLPLDVTGKVPIERGLFERLRTTGYPADEAVLALTDVWFDYRDHQYQQRVPYTCMHDPLTVAAITHPELLKTIQAPVVVEADGCTRIKEEGKEVSLCYDVDQPAFEKLFFETMARQLPQPYDARLSHQR